MFPTIFLDLNSNKLDSTKFFLASGKFTSYEKIRLQRVLIYVRHTITREILFLSLIFLRVENIKATWLQRENWKKTKKRVENKMNQ